MSEQVKRYDMSGFGDGMVEREDGAFYHMDDYDALHAEAEALRANIVRLTSNPADHRYWEGRYRDAEAGLEVARGLLLEAKRLRNAVNIYPGRTACAWADSRMDERIDAFLTATPAPEAPVVNQRFTAEQGERQEAVAWKVVGVHEKHRHPHVLVEHTLKLAEGQAAHWRNRGCSVEVIPLYTTPQPGPDVRGLVEALEQADEYLSHNKLNEIGSGSILHCVMQEALAAHRQAQQSASN